jgi:hypothetical protein
MAHNGKTLAMVSRRFAGGPAEVLAPSNRVSAGMVQMAEELDALRKEVRLHRQRRQYDADHAAGRMTTVQYDECTAAIDAYLRVLSGVQ